MTTPDRNPTSSEVLEWFQAQRIQKLNWLATFSAGRDKRTDWEIDSKQTDLWVLEYLISKQAAAIASRGADSGSN